MRSVFADRSSGPEIHRLHDPFTLMKNITLTLVVLAAASAAWAAATPKKPIVYPLGYDDTPLIFSGSKWKVHDIARPAPTAVKPGDKPGTAPADAIVLFDGKSTDAFVAKDGVPCKWKIENGELIVDGGDSWTKQTFGSCQLHVEWKSHPNTEGNSQKKGNGGVFLMDRYEIQMVDNSPNNPTYADGVSGAVYGQTPPLVNATRSAGEWQTYDIIFTAPKVVAGKVTEPAHVTVFVNGVVVQNHTKLLGPTLHKKATSWEGTFPASAPFRFQDHKNSIPNRMRNIWVRAL